MVRNFRQSLHSIGQVYLVTDGLDSIVDSFPLFFVQLAQNQHCAGIKV